MGDKIQEGDGLEPDFQTSFPDDPEKIKKPTGFQTAFPEDEELQPGEVLCQYGCGKPGQYFGAGPQGGELPRCSVYIADCPAAGRKVARAAKNAGRLGRRWRNS